MEFTVQNIVAVIHDVSISGGLGVDGLVDARFAGEADLRDYDGMITCEMVENFIGVACNACGSDGEVQCMKLEAEDVGGERIPGLTLVPNETPEECDPGTE